MRSSFLCPSSLVFVKLLLSAQPRSSDSHPNFTSQVCENITTLAPRLSLLFFSFSLSLSLRHVFILWHASRKQVQKKKKKAKMVESNMMNRSHPHQLLRFCEVILQRVVTAGNIPYFTAEVHFHKLWPSGAQILLSGSHRRAPRTTWGQQQGGGRPSPCPVNKVSSLLCHTDAQQVRSSHARWQIQESTRIGKHTNSSSPLRLSDVFSAWTTAAPCCSTLCALVFHCSGHHSCFSLQLFFYSYHRHLLSRSYCPPPSIFSVLLYSARMKLHPC